jgi:hypothetical protein
MTLHCYTYQERQLSHEVNLGRFIGSGGSILRRLLLRVPGSYIHSHGPKRNGLFLMYATDGKTMHRIKKEIAKCERRNIAGKI